MRTTASGAIPAPENRGLGGTAAEDRVVDHQDDDGADHRADETGALVRPIPADRLAEPARDERADDAEYGGYDEPAGIAPRGEELGDEPGEKADDDHSDDMHGRWPSSIAMPWKRSNRVARSRACPLRKRPRAATFGWILPVAA